ncbi:MAG TPA: hypothetical protein VH420_10745 [Gaiellaceae bacterium]|jgi:hypothetical protein
MTDFCRNRLTAWGDTEELAAFVEQVATDEQPLSFETIAPTPAALLKEGWYEWRIEHWGTKWDAEFEDVTEPLRVRRTRATYVFLTAFAPATAWIERAGEEFPALTFRLEYAAPDGAFSGVKEVRGGSVVRDAREPVAEEAGSE